MFGWQQRCLRKDRVQPVDARYVVTWGDLKQVRCDPIQYVPWCGQERIRREEEWVCGSRP